MTVNCTWSRAIRAGDEDGSRAIAAGCEMREISTDRRRRDGAGSLLGRSTETVHAADGADGEHGRFAHAKGDVDNVRRFAMRRAGSSARGRGRVYLRSRVLRSSVYDTHAGSIRTCLPWKRSKFCVLIAGRGLIPA